MCSRELHPRERTMAELPLETEETASDLPEGLIPPEIEDDGDTGPVETSQGAIAPASYGPVVLRERYLSQLFGSAMACADG